MQLLTVLIVFQLTQVAACSLLNCKGRGHFMKKSLLADDLKMQFVDKKCGESNMLLEALNASKNSLKGILTDVFQNRCSKKFRNIHKNTPVFVSLFKNLHA